MLKKIVVLDFEVTYNQINYNVVLEKFGVFSWTDFSQVTSKRATIMNAKGIFSQVGPDEVYTMTVLILLILLILNWEFLS